MPIDASIYSLTPQFKAPDPLNQLAKIMQVQGMQQQQQLGNFQMESARREQEQAITLNRLYSEAVRPDGSFDRSRLLTGAATGGLGSKIPALQKTFAEQDKAEREAQKAQLDLARERIGVYGQLLGSVNDQASYDAAKAQAAKLGLDVSTAPAAYDPAFIEARRNEALTAAQQLEQKWKAMQYTTPDANAKLQAQTSTANNQRSVNASMENARATRDVAAATRESASTKDKRDTEMKLADDYRTQSKPFKEVSDAHRTIITALESATTSPAATLAGATKFMKLLDPGSVVRESELGMALAASGVFDRALNYVNVLQKGKVLTPTQAQDFKNVANQIYAAAQQQQQAIDADYRKKAQTYGLKPEMIVQDLGQTKAAPSVSTGRESSGKVSQGPSIIDQADAILRGGN